MGAVVEQPAVGHALQGLQRAGVIGQHRAAGAVGAGEHQRRRAAEGPVRQQYVQRRVGQQDAEAAVFAEPDGVPGAAGGPLFQQHDGAAGGFAAARPPPARGGTASGRCPGRGRAPPAAFPRGACGGAAGPRRRGSRASQARWMPPVPLTATICPAASARWASATGSPGRSRPAASRKKARGPQAGQQLGWAW